VRGIRFRGRVTSHVIRSQINVIVSMKATAMIRPEDFESLTDSAKHAGPAEKTQADWPPRAADGQGEGGGGRKPCCPAIDRVAGEAQTPGPRGIRVSVVCMVD